MLLSKDRVARGSDPGPPIQGSPSRDAKEEEDGVFPLHTAGFNPAFRTARGKGAPPGGAAPSFPAGLPLSACCVCSGTRPCAHSVATVLFIQVVSPTAERLARPPLGLAQDHFIAKIKPKI